MIKFYEIMVKMHKINFKYEFLQEYKEPFLPKKSYTLKDFFDYIPFTIFYYIMYIYKKTFEKILNKEVAHS